jgi:hypothetical protein
MKIKYKIVIEEIEISGKRKKHPHHISTDLKLYKRIIKFLKNKK